MGPGSRVDRSSSGARRMDTRVYFVFDDAPQEWLTEGEHFALYEGRRCVGHGEVQGKDEADRCGLTTEVGGRNIRLALTPGLSLITMISCDRRKWNVRNWLTPRNPRTTNDGVRDDGPAAQDARSGCRRSYRRGRSADLGAVDDDDQYVRRRGDARTDPPPGRGRLRDRPRHHSQEGRRRGRQAHPRPDPHPADCGHPLRLPDGPGLPRCGHAVGPAGRGQDPDQPR